MGEEGTWGDGSMLSVASLLYKKQIVVYHENSSPISLRDPSTFSDPNPIRLGYVNNNHYISLKPKQATTTQTCHMDAATEPDIGLPQSPDDESTKSTEQEQVAEPRDGNGRQRTISVSPTPDTHGRSSSPKAAKITETETVYTATASMSQPTDLGMLDELAYLCSQRGRHIIHVCLAPSFATSSHLGSPVETGWSSLFKRKLHFATVAVILVHPVTKPIRHSSVADIRIGKWHWTAARDSVNTHRALATYKPCPFGMTGNCGQSVVLRYH